MPPRSFPRLLGIVTLGVLSTSTASILIRFARQDNVPALVVAAYRLGLATLILTPIVLRRSRAELRRLTRQDVWLALGSGVFLGLHFATWVSSLDYTTITSSIVLVSTAPIWVAIASWVPLPCGLPFEFCSKAAGFREQLSRSTIVGLVVSVIGGLIVGVSDACDPHTGACVGLGLAGSQLWGDLLALMGAWFVVGYLLIGRYLRAHVSLLPYVFLVYGAAALTLIVIVGLAGQSFVIGDEELPYTARAFLWLLLLAIVPQLLGHSSYNYALRFLPPTFVAIVTLAEPIGASVLAYLILHELPATLTIVGAAIILVGIGVASLSSRSIVPET